jgi:RNA polymerase sigma factor (TIGR02999 family)
MVAVTDAVEPGLGSLFDELYQELRRLAHGKLARVRRPGATLSTTALVHEAFVKLESAGRVGVRDREHFLALAARAMRQVLVDAARTRQAVKRGAGVAPLALDEAEPSIDDLVEEVIAVDAALVRLETLDERLARVVEWRVFAGMSEDEIAGALGVTSRTVRRDWQKARAFLVRELGLGQRQATGLA